MRDDIKFFLSLGAVLAGWGAGFLYYILYSLLVFGNAPEPGAFFVFPGIFILLGWTLIFLPILRVVPSGHRLFEPRVFSCVGAVLGAVAYLALVDWWADLRGPDFPPPLLYAVVAGGTAAAVYAFAHRTLLRRARTEGS